MTTIIGLVLMIILGILSAALSHYRRNYYLRVFDDIMGREEDDRSAVKLGRAFIYGFLFPLYFALAVLGIIALVAFLVVAGIIAAIIFVFVWVTEKLLPYEWFGDLMLGLFQKLGLSGALQPATTASMPSRPVEQSLSPAPPPQSPAAPTKDEPKEEPKDDPANPFPGGGINRTRVHSLD
ncbi:MAG: hypothetical protein LDL33_05625 [Desulfomonile sp.]|nr:hypothetical protein [Desulfomonile sp.]